MPPFVRTPRVIPTISDARQLSNLMQNWKVTLRQGVRASIPPPPPFNFTATGIRGAILLTWAAVQNPVIKGQLGQQNVGPDGYEILKSLSGDFVSDLIVIPVRDANQTSYSDPVGGDPVTCSYRMHSTSGTLSQPHGVTGPDTGTLRATSLDSADLTPPTTLRDTYVTDNIRATTRRGRYQ